MSLILFGSQRGSPAELGAHLTNEHDNELVEVMQLRGAIADDPIGALSQWGVEFDTMTKGEKSVYSLSANPAIGIRLTDTQVFELADRISNALNLEPSRRLVVRHIKMTGSGQPREHFHIVWPRVDMNECRAIHISYDRLKLMQVTREFARDHGMELPAGFYDFEQRKLQSYRQLSLYEKSLLDRGFPSKEEHQKIITPLWEGRVSPEGFIKALDHHGYTLAFGRRPVVVDVHGKEHSLAKLIADPKVRVGDVRGYLGETYSEDKLPSVEEAKAQAAKFKEDVKAYRRAEDEHERMEALKAGQEARRGKLEAEITARREHDRDERSCHERQALAERQAQKSTYLEERRHIREARKANEPTGLAAFLGKVSGVSLIRTTVHNYQDRQRYNAFMEQRREILERQHDQSEELRLAHQMRALDDERKRRALSYREAQEIRSLKRDFEQKARLAMRGRDKEPAPTPAPHLALGAPGRSAVPAKAAGRYTGDAYKNRTRPPEFHARQAGCNAARAAEVSEKSFERAASGKRPDRREFIGDEAHRRSSISESFRRLEDEAERFEKTPSQPSPRDGTNPKLRDALNRYKAKGALHIDGVLSAKFDLAAGGIDAEIHERSSSGSNGEAPGSDTSAKRDFTRRDTGPKRSRD